MTKTGMSLNGCYILSGLILHLRNIEIGESPAFVVSYEQGKERRREGVPLSYLSRMFTEVQVRNSPSKDHSGLCILDLPSKNVWGHSRTLVIT